MNSNKRQRTPQSDTQSKKAKNPYNPRDEAVAPKRNTPPQVKEKAPEQAQSYSDSDSEARDKAYHDSEKAKEFNFDFELALDEDNIKEAMAMATTDEQRKEPRKRQNI